MDDLHAWVEQRLLARALATLNAADELRFDEHVRACAHCRARLAELTAETGADDAARGHLPAAMIARWQRARSELAGLEREAVQLHLERCDTCREELRLVGHAVDPSLAPGTRPKLRELTELPEVPELPRQPRLARRTRPWREWWTGGITGALATAAILLLMMRPQTTQPEDAQPGGTQPEGRPPQTAQPETTPSRTTGSGTTLPAASTLVALPWTAPAALRGADVTLQVAAGTRELGLALGVPAEVDPTASRQVSVWGPSGSQVARLPLAAESVVAGTAFLVLRVSGALVPGTYRVVVHTARSNSGAPDSTESFFDLAVLP